jgi:VanZ family protein
LKRSTEHTLRAWILVVAYLVLIFGVSSIPQATLSRAPFKISDKVAHAAEYAGFGLLLMLAFRRTLARTSRWALIVVVVVLGATVGVLDEMYQLTVPGRESDVLDWTADVFGIVIGIAGAVGLDTMIERSRMGAPNRRRPSGQQHGR